MTSATPSPLQPPPRATGLTCSPACGREPTPSGRPSTRATSGGRMGPAVPAGVSGTTASPASPCPPGPARPATGRSATTAADGDAANQDFVNAQAAAVAVHTGDTATIGFW